MAKDIFDSIIEKEYHQLSAKELVELREYCANEQEFLAMKHVLAQSKNMASGPKLTTKAKTKNALDEQFSALYQGNLSQKFANWKVIAPIAAIVAIGFAIWLNIQSNTTNNQLAENTISTEIKPEKSTADDSSNTLNKAKEHIEKTSNRQKDEVAEQYLPHLTANEKSTVPAVSSRAMEIQEDETSMKHEEYSVQPAIQKEPVIATQSINLEAELGKSNTFRKYSTPAVSASDISIDASKQPMKTEASISTSIAVQKQHFRYLHYQY